MIKVAKNDKGKNVIKISKSDWLDIGKQAGWLKESQYSMEQGEQIKAEREWKAIQTVAKNNNVDVEKLEYAFNLNKHDWRTTPADRDAQLTDIAKRMGITDEHLGNMVDEVHSYMSEAQYDPSQDMTGQDEDTRQYETGTGPYAEPDMPRAEY